MPKLRRWLLTRAHPAAYKADLGERIAVIENAVNTLASVLDALVDHFNAHTHRADGGQAGEYNTSTPQSDTATVAAVTPITASKSEVELTVLEE